MDWPEYKALCNKTHVFSRWALEQTHARLPSHLSLLLRRGTATEPLVKPADHKGDSRTDMYEVTLGKSSQHELVQALTEHECPRTTQGKGLDKPSPLLRAWQELLDDTNST